MALINFARTSFVSFVCAILLCAAGQGLSQEGTAALQNPNQSEIKIDKPFIPKTDAPVFLESALSQYPTASCQLQEGYTINFENISVIQLIQFISKISGTNFIFDSQDLNFNVTIVSEDPTSVADLSAALVQILKIHNLSITEQGNNVLIYKKSQDMSKVSTVITDANVGKSCDQAIITRVFQLYNVQANKVAEIVRPLVSPQAAVEASMETRHLIVTDITANVNRIAELLAALDTPNLAVDVAQYKVRHAKEGNIYALANYAREILAPLSGGTTLTLTPEPQSGTIFVVATPNMLDKALQVLSSLDVEGLRPAQPPPQLIIPPPIELPSDIMENNKFYMYKLKYRDGLEIGQALQNIGSNLQYAGVSNIEFVNTVLSAQWVEVNNSIVLTGTDQSIKKVVDLLEELDTLPKQVFIEVLVIDTTLVNSLDFGVQWIALGEEQERLAYGSGLLSNPNPNPNINSPTQSVAANIPPYNPLPNSLQMPTPGMLNGSSAIGTLTNATEAFGLGFIGNIIRHAGRSYLTLGALLSALDEEGDTRIVLNPRVMVEDTQPAAFFVGTNIPYITTSTVIQQTGSVTQNVQYEDIGVDLQVIPTIAPNNMVTLQINQTVAEVTGQANNMPTTNKTLASTRVHVPDGTFLVMSGLVREQCTYIKSGIPCLGWLPWIGAAFSRTIEQKCKRNLIFFIRPKVITNIEEGILLTNEEGYKYNWESNPCSMRECCEQAPECEIYPSPCWPPDVEFCPASSY